MINSGILVHGRHLQTVNWERLVWGDPSADKLGSLPTMVDLVLRESRDQPITTIVVGTGASQTPEGVVEAVAMKQYLLEHFDELELFKQIKRSKAMQTPAAREVLESRLQAIVPETTSLNTAQEVVAAAGIFSTRGVDNITHVTSASHAPRCVQLHSCAREMGLIPPEQQWSIRPDHMTFRDLPVSSTTILEPWHRGDTDPIITSSTAKPIEEVLKGYFGLTPEQKLIATARIASIINEA